MFIRRLYYNKQTNDIVLNYMSKGAIRHTTVDEDFEFYAPLKGLDKNNTGLIEWLEEDENIENLFNTKVPKIVEGELTFVEPATPPADPNPYGIPKEVYNQIVDDYTLDLIEQGVL